MIEGDPAKAPDLSVLKIDETARSRGGSKWLRWFAAAVGLALIVSAVVFYIMRKTPVVEVASAHAPASGEVALLNASGYVTARRKATVAAKITARVLLTAGRPNGFPRFCFVKGMMEAAGVGLKTRFENKQVIEN